MNRFILGLSGLLGGAVALAQPAAAGIPLPCSGNKVVLVARTGPEIEVQAMSGRWIHADLGYRFSGCGGGDWVAYPGPKLGYQELDEAQVRAYAASAGLADVPDRPSYLLHPSASWATWLWILVGSFVAIGSMLAGFAQRHGGDVPSSARPSGLRQRPGR